MPTGIGADRLYAELAGSINCSVNNRVTLTHDLWRTPDDVDCWCTDSIPDPLQFLLISKGATTVVWEVVGTTRVINFRCYARKNHTLIDSTVSNASLASGGGAASPSPLDALKTRSLFDFGTTAKSLSA